MWNISNKIINKLEIRYYVEYNINGDSQIYGFYYSNTISRLSACVPDFINLMHNHIKRRNMMLQAERLTAAI